MNGTPPAGVTMINAHGILLFVGGRNIIYRMTDTLVQKCKSIGCIGRDHTGRGFVALGRN